VEKESKKRVLEAVKKAASEKYEIEWDSKGKPHYKKKSNIKRGGRSRATGSQFELKVRKDLEEKGRIVDKWTNNVEFELDERGEIIFETGKLIISRKYNPFKRMLIIGTGFPDFISIKHVHDGMYSVIGVEVKMNGILSKIEKEKCSWYLQNKIFSEIWIAKKGEKRGKIVYEDFIEKYGKKYNKT